MTVVPGSRYLLVLVNNSTTTPRQLWYWYGLLCFVHMTWFITFLILNEFKNETVPNVPKRSRPPKSGWIKSFINKLFDGPPRGLVVSTYPPIWLFTTTFERQVGSSHVQASHFDSDSQTLMVDDGASACITNDKNDFIGTPRQSQEKLMVSMDRLKQHTEEQSDGLLKMIRV